MMQVNGLFSSRCVDTTIISTDVSFHYSDVIMSAMVSNHQPHDCLLNRLDADKKINIKALRHWPLWGEFTGDRFFPHTKGQ